MSKNSLLPSGFEKELRRIHHKKKASILDVILFGSTVTGKKQPGDTDIFLLMKEEPDLSLASVIRKAGEEYGLTVNVLVKTYDELLSHDFLARESFLSQGYSIIKKEFISTLLNYSSFTLFKYNLKNLSKSKRMLFYYSLYGRNKKEDGMLKKLSAIKFSDNLLLVPLSNVDEAQNYLAYWNLTFMEMPLLIPRRIVQSEKFRHSNRKD